eukprot:9375430-Lingulodinium_polyedra.AAC.1
MVARAKCTHRSLRVIAAGLRVRPSVRRNAAANVRCHASLQGARPPVRDGSQRAPTICQAAGAGLPMRAGAMGPG